MEKLTDAGSIPATSTTGCVVRTTHPIPTWESVPKKKVRETGNCAHPWRTTRCRSEPSDGSSLSGEDGSEEVDYRRTQHHGDHNARRSKECARYHHKKITEDDAERDPECTKCWQSIKSGKRRRQ